MNHEMTTKQVVMIVRTDVIHDSRVLREARVLQKNGYDITVVGMKQIGKEPTHLIIEDINVYLIKVRTKNLLPVSMFGWIFKYFEFLIKAVIKTISLKPKIIHSHDLDGLLPGLYCSKILDSKLIYDSHEIWTETATIGKTEKKISQFLEKRIIKHCDDVITVSDSFAAELAQRYDIKTPRTILNCPENRAQNEHHAVEDKAKKINKTNKIREKLDLPDKEPILLYQGLIRSQRGLQNIVKAMDHINSGILVFMGSGELVDELMPEMDRLKGRFFIMDPVLPKDIIKWSSSADVGFSSLENTCLNHYLTLPNKLFEYIWAGLPVIVCDNPEMSKIVTKYQIGEVCNFSDPLSIAAAVNKLISCYSDYTDPEKFAAVRSEYNWEKQAEKLLQIYQELQRDE